MDTEVEKVIREYIKPLVHMSLATVSGSKPWVCEVHFASDEDLNLYFLSKATRRHSQEIAKNPHVAGNIVKQFALKETVMGVYFEGTAKILEPGEEQDKAFRCCQDQLQVSDGTIEEASRDDGHKFYKISIENWYVFGKIGDLPAQKHKLAWKRP